MYSNYCLHLVIQTSFNQSKHWLMMSHFGLCKSVFSSPHLLLCSFLSWTLNLLKTFVSTIRLNAIKLKPSSSQSWSCCGCSAWAPLKLCVQSGTVEETMTMKRTDDQGQVLLVEMVDEVTVQMGHSANKLQLRLLCCHFSVTACFLLMFLQQEYVLCNISGFRRWRKEWKFVKRCC